MTEASKKQIGGDHYKKLKIQPIEYIHTNRLDWFQGNVVKYVTRHKFKNGEEDINKAIHILELIKEFQYPKESNHDKTKGCLKAKDRYKLNHFPEILENSKGDKSADLSEVMDILADSAKVPQED